MHSKLAMQLPEEGHGIRIGIDLCAAVTVFPKSVADDFPMLHSPGKAKSYRPARGKLLPGLGARKVQVKLIDRPSQAREPESGGHAQSLDRSVTDERHGTRCVLHQERQRHQVVCVPRGQWHEAGARESEWSIRVSLSHTARVLRRTALQVRILHFRRWNRSRTLWSGLRLQTTQTDVQCRKSHERSSVVTSRQCGGSSGSRDVVYPIPGGGLLGRTE